MNLKILLLFLFVSVSSSQQIFAQEEAPLDPPSLHQKKSASPFLISPQFRAPLPEASNTEALIARQTPIRSQLARGTCSIFASTAVLESMMIIRGKAQESIDLSEEWLEYIVEFHRHGEEGSDAPSNFSALVKYGAINESSMPYIGVDWTDVKSKLSKERCGKVAKSLKKACLVSHYSPRLLTAHDNQLSNPSSRLFNLDFLKVRNEAFQFRDEVFTNHINSEYQVLSIDEVKALLNRGIPLQIDLDFYYGAWNHREGPNFGIPRAQEPWAEGMVGYPEIGSVDRKMSEAHPEGHSVVLVGYDDNAEMKTSQLMEDGSTKEFTYKGVLYFKNSWGASSFGVNFKLNGHPYPGYGAITQKYAEEFGTFFQLPLKK